MPKSYPYLISIRLSLCLSFVLHGIAPHFVTVVIYNRKMFIKCVPGCGSPAVAPVGPSVVVFNDGQAGVVRPAGEPVVAVIKPVFYVADTSGA